MFAVCPCLANVRVGWFSRRDGQLANYGVQASFGDQSWELAAEPSRPTTPTCERLAAGQPPYNHSCESRYRSSLQRRLCSIGKLLQ